MSNDTMQPDHNPEQDQSSGNEKIYPSFDKEYPDYYESNDIEYASVRNSKMGGDTYAEFFKDIACREARYVGTNLPDDTLMSGISGNAEFVLSVDEDQCVIPGLILMIGTLSVACDKHERWYATDGTPAAPTAQDFHMQTAQLSPVAKKDKIRWDNNKGVGLPFHALHGFFGSHAYLSQEDNDDKAVNTFANYKSNTYSMQMYSAFSSFFAEPQDLGDCAARFRNDRMGPFKSGEFMDRYFFKNFETSATVMERVAVPENQLQCFSRDNNSSTVDLKDLFAPGQRMRLFLPVRDGIDNKTLVYNNTMHFAPGAGGGEQTDEVTKLNLRLKDFKILYTVGRCRPEKWNAWLANTKTYAYQMPKAVSDVQSAENKAIVHIVRPDMCIMSSAIDQAVEKVNITSENDWVPDCVVMWLGRPGHDTQRDCDTQMVMGIPDTCKFKSVELLRNNQAALDIMKDFEQQYFQDTVRDRQAMALGWLGRESGWGYPHVLKSTYDSYLQDGPSRDSLYGQADRYLAFRLYVGRKENRFAGSMRKKDQFDASIKLTEAPPAGTHVFMMLLSNADVVFRSHNLRGSEMRADYKIDPLLTKPTLTAIGDK